MYFTLGMIGNKTGHSVKYVQLYGKFINEIETLTKRLRQAIKEQFDIRPPDKSAKLEIIIFISQP